MILIYTTLVLLLTLAGIDILDGTTINIVAATMPIFEHRWQLDVLRYLG